MKKTMITIACLLTLLAVAGQSKKDNQAILTFANAPTASQVVQILTVNGYTCTDVDADVGIIQTDYKQTEKQAISVKFTLTLMGKKLYIQGQWLSRGLPDSPEPVTNGKWPVDKLAWSKMMELTGFFTYESITFRRL